MYVKSNLINASEVATDGKDRVALNANQQKTKEKLTQQM